MLWWRAASSTRCASTMRRRDGQRSPWSACWQTKADSSYPYRFDTPQRRKPHGCSGDAHPTGSRARLKVLPGPSGRDLHPQASEALTPLWLKRRAPRPRCVRPCPHGNGFPWNAHRRLRWHGARCPRTELRTRRLNHHHRRPSGSSQDTPDHCRCNGVACGGLKPQTVSPFLGGMSDLFSVSSLALMLPVALECHLPLRSQAPVLSLWVTVIGMLGMLAYGIFQSLLTRKCALISTDQCPRRCGQRWSRRLAAARKLRSVARQGVPTRPGLGGVDCRSRFLGARVGLLDLPYLCTMAGALAAGKA